MSGGPRVHVVNSGTCVGDVGLDYVASRPFAWDIDRGVVHIVNSKS